MKLLLGGLGASGGRSRSFLEAEGVGVAGKQRWDTLHTCFQLGNPCVPGVWAGAGAWEYGHSGLVLCSWGSVTGFGMWVRRAWRDGPRVDACLLMHLSACALCVRACCRAYSVCARLVKTSV